MSTGVNADERSDDASEGACAAMEEQESRGRAGRDGRAHLHRRGADGAAAFVRGNRI